MQQQTIGRYQILEQVAAGGQGTVYRAWDTSTGQVVALKVLHPHLSADPSILERFHREARLAAFVSHPNITQIFEVGQDGDRHFISMEYLPVGIHSLIEAQGSLPIERAAEICLQTALALQAASDRGIIHRDIKPQNLLLGQDGTVKVTDFGIARATALSTMTRTGALMGTPHYMSPEQAQGTRVDIRSDIYSLGIVLYQLLTGDLPFEADTPFELMRQHIEERPASVRGARSAVPQALERVVNTCLEKDPDRRFQTPNEFVRALRQAVPGARAAPTPQPPIQAPPAQQPASAAETAGRPPGVPEQRPETARPQSPGPRGEEHAGRGRPRWIWVGLVVSILVAVSAVGVTFWVIDMARRDGAIVEPLRTPVPATPVRIVVAAQPTHTPTGISPVVVPPTTVPPPTNTPFVVAPPEVAPPTIDPTATPASVVTQSTNTPTATSVRTVVRMTATPTATPVRTVIQITATPTATPSPVAAPPTNTATATPSPVAAPRTNTPTATPSTIVLRPTSTPRPRPTNTPLPSPTNTPRPRPTATHTPTPVPAVVAQPTAVSDDQGLPAEPSGSVTVVVPRVYRPHGLPRSCPGGCSEAMYLSGVTETLLNTRFENEGSVAAEPMLAEWWEFDDSLRVLTFGLRQDVMFHSGWGEMNAWDVVFSLEDAIMNPESTHAARSFESIAAVFLLDDFTVRVEFREFDPRGALYYLTPFDSSVGIVSADVSESHDEDELQSLLIGVGPFVVDEWVPRESIRLTAHQEYYGRPLGLGPHVESLQWVEINEAAVRMAFIHAGQAHLSTLMDAGHARELLSSGLLLENNGGSGMMGGVSFAGNYWEAHNPSNGETLERTRDISKPWIGDPFEFGPSYDESTPSMVRSRMVREALATATDRNLINEILLHGLGSVNYQPSLSVNSPLHEDWMRWAFDPDRAWQLLAEAGYPDGFEMDLWVGQSPSRTRLGEVLAAIWAEYLGVEIVLERGSVPEYNVGLLDRTTSTPGVNLCFGPETNPLYPSDWPRGFYASSMSDFRAGIGQELPHASEIYNAAIAAPDKGTRETLTLVSIEINRYWANCVGVIEQPRWTALNPDLVAEWGFLPTLSGTLGGITNVRSIKVRQ